jgi:hypothetical protein
MLRLACITPGVCCSEGRKTEREPLATLRPSLVFLAVVELFVLYRPQPVVLISRAVFLEELC